MQLYSNCCNNQQSYQGVREYAGQLMLTRLISARNDLKIAPITDSFTLFSLYSPLPLKIESATMTKDFKQQSATGSAFGQYGLGWMVGGVAIGLLIGAGMYALANKGNVADTNASLTTDTTAVNTSGALTPSTTTSGTAAPAGNNGAASLQDSPAKTNEAVDETPGFSYHAVLPQLEIDVPLSAQVEQQMNAAQAKAEKPAADPKPVTEKKESEKQPTKVEKTPEKIAEKTPEKAAVVPEKKTSAPVSATPTGFNAFQIGSYKTQDQAATMQQRLQQHGLSSRIEAANVQGATWYRVKMGPASSAATFHQWQQTLSGMGISPMPLRM
jgi:cell division septation protein DedD